MIVGIGCDIVDHKTSLELNWDKDVSVIQRIFSENEIKIYYEKKDLKFLSGRFAAKEAVLKCLGTGMHDGIALPDIQILKTLAGAPTIILSGKIKEISNSKSIDSWHVSISHSPNSSYAFVIAEKN